MIFFSSYVTSFHIEMFWVMVFCMLIISCNCLGVWKKVPKKKDSGRNDRAFFLGICINYPNGLFNSSLFQVWPWAEDFLSVFGCSVECMHSNYPCSLWYVLECCCYCTFFEVQFLVIAILVWTCLTVFFLGSSSKYYIVTSCGYFRCRVDAPLAVVRPSQNPDLHFRWSDPSRQ